MSIKEKKGFVKQLVLPASGKLFLTYIMAGMQNILIGIIPHTSHSCIVLFHMPYTASSVLHIHCKLVKGDGSSKTRRQEKFKRYLFSFPDG